jgi:hypothetical protein
LKIISEVSIKVYSASNLIDGSANLSFARPFTSIHDIRLTARLDPGPDRTDRNCLLRSREGVFNDSKARLKQGARTDFAWTIYNDIAMDQSLQCQVLGSPDFIVEHNAKVSSAGGANQPYEKPPFVC